MVSTGRDLGACPLNPFFFVLYATQYCVESVRPSVVYAQYTPIRVLGSPCLACI